MKVIYKYSTSTIVIKSFYKTRLTMIQVKYNKPISQRLSQSNERQDTKEN